MATKLEPDYPSSPTNDESDGEDPNSAEPRQQYKINAATPSNNNVEQLLKRLQSTGALIKKPKQEYHCYTCSEDFEDWEELENHLFQHISQPTVLLDKLPSEDEDEPPSGDENWSDEEESAAVPAKGPAQKIDISQILKHSGISIKKQSAEAENSPDSTLSKLSGLGFTIKKNITPLKKEPEDPPKNSIIQKIGSLGGLKLTLKSAGDNNSFKVINGLKDFQASDEEGSDNDENKEDRDGEREEKGDGEGSAAENDSANEESDDRKECNEDLKSRETVQVPNKQLKNLQGKIVAKIEPKTPVKMGPVKSPVKEIPKFPNRPAIKQTPKRGTNEPIIAKESPQTIEQPPIKVQTPVKAPTPTPDRRLSRQSSQSSVENVTVKQEVITNEHHQSNIPLFSGQIKSERISPPKESISTPIIAKVKSEPDVTNSPQISQPVVSNLNTSIPTTPLLPVTKTEDSGPTIIEINGDSNDEDDDCCVVSATPAPDIKPIVPKTESVSTSYPPPLYPTSQSNYTTSATNVLSSRLTGAPSLAKQHNFNWNAPDSKPAIDMLEKSADDIFESLLSNSTKKEGVSLSEASEYISLDTLGPQHSCDVCNVRFTDITLLENHKRVSGHSRSIVPSSSASSLMPYNPTSNIILSSLLPVKQLADQVGKLSSIDGGGSGFTHQQNVMINIQAYPGASGVIPPPPLYNYPGQTMPSNYSQGSNNMFNSVPGQQVPGSYGGQQNYMGDQGYGQFQPTMPNTSYPGATPTSPFSVANTQYTTASPLQSMQQAVYGQPSNGLSNPPGQMGPPGGPYVPTSSPGSPMKPSPNSGIRIQNVQTFPPGQLPPRSTELHAHLTTPGQMVGGQMPPPSPIRMANNAVSGPRPRMAGIRGPRPSIRPGIQVHGQIRGSKPGIRMPMKRPSNMIPGNAVKKRPNMLLPDKHDNEDCQVMAMQKQREGLPMIQSVQGAKDKINLGSQISITKKTVNKEASAMANVLASRGISIKQKQKSRSPTPERPVPHIPNLGAGVSIKHTSKSNNFSIPEAKVGGGMLSCKVCKKMFMNHNSLAVHMSSSHPQVEFPMFKCDECPASYPKSFQLQHHKRVFHNISGPNKELGLPVVDLAQEDNLKRLSNLGIYSFIPLANREQAGGCFGIPVISVHNMQNGLTNSLQALGADGLLSLGPLKPLPN